MGAGWVLHVDMDQFLAAVEVLRRPELAGRPVIVGGRGDPTERAVVSTASYEAREYGVRSGMPLKVAVRKCPDAVFLPVDFDVYTAASTEVMATLRGLTWGERPVVVEVLGWDEAFVGPAPDADVTDAETPERLADRVRSAVLEATGLHCSVGVGDNKLRAKIATEFGKPRGSFTLTAANWFAVMGERPTEAIWGIGRKTARRLAALDVHTVADLAAADVARLAAELGPTMGPWFGRLGRGEDPSPVNAEPYVARGHGREETFQTDVEDWAQVAEEVRRLTRRVVEDIHREGRPAIRVGIKVRYRNFFTLTRIHKLAEPTSDPEVLAAEAVALLDRVEQDKPVRLLGVRLEMVEPEGGY